MAFDYKREYKEFYQPKGVPSIVMAPRATYVAVRGEGIPFEEFFLVTKMTPSRNRSMAVWLC